MTSKFKSDNIWPPFWPKNCQNSEIKKKKQFCGQKGGQIVSELNSEAKFGILSSFQMSEAQDCYDFHILVFWPPIAFS